MSGSQGGRGDAPRCLVVGASSGIGRAVALAAADRGCRVVAAARRHAELDELVATAGDVVLPVPMDLLDPAACDRLVTTASEAWGGLDAVIVAAGATQLADVADTDHDLWAALLGVNLVGPALVVRAALSALEASPRGRVVFLSSITVADAWPGLVAYAAAKAGLEKLALGLQHEHPKIGFSTVVVGPTDTTVNDHWDREAARQAYRRWRSEGRMGVVAMQPSEVAAVVLDVALGPVRVPRVSVQPDV